MVTIVADNADTEKSLNTLVNLISDGGGGLHSNLVIHGEGSVLRVETKDPMDSDREIIRLSREVLLPSDQYIFGAKNDEFTVEFPQHSNFTNLQKELMETMVWFYNSMGKAKGYKEESFLLSVIHYPDLLDLFKRGRTFPEDFQQSIDLLHEHEFSEEAMNGAISRGFFKTRVLGYSDYIRESKVSILMPVVDFLNHHWSGAGFNVTPNTNARPGDLVVQNRQPIEGSRECYAFYGVMDSLDTLIRYDFVDVLSPLISSIPLDIDVPDFGMLRIEGAMGAINTKAREEGAEDLVRHIPVVSVNKGNDRVLNVSHLRIPTDQSKLALRRVLALLLKRLVGDDVEVDQDFLVSWMKDAERQVIDTNIAYYEEVLVCVRKHMGKDGETFGLKRIEDMAKHQLTGLQSYECLEG